MKSIVKSSIIRFFEYSKFHRIIPCFKGQGSILMFHRVLPTFDAHNRLRSNLNLEVSAQFLESVILYFRNSGHEIISLDQLYERLLHGSNEKPFVCFTFDDGYRDNYEIAYPILKKHNVPFAIYVTTSFPNKKAILWWYMLEDLLLQSNVVNFTYDNEEYSFHARNMKQKNNAFHLITILIRTLTQYQVKEFIYALFSGSDISIDAYDALIMSWDQIVELSNDPLVTIGAHTVNHFSLKQLATKEAEQEIMISRTQIEKKIGKPVEHFAYPFGTRHNASKREFQIVKNCQFKTATTTRCANVFSAHKNYLECLPRVPVEGHQNLAILEFMCSGTTSLRYGYALRRTITD